MNKDDYAKQVIAVLNSSLDTLRPEVTQKLQSAREQACAMAGQHSVIHHHNKSGHSLALNDWMRQHRSGLVGMLLVMLLLAMVAVWNNSSSNDDEATDIDTALLTGDLPVNAYLDGHMSKWVNNSSDY